MEEYKSNSHKSKEEAKAKEKKEIKPVITGKATKKKNHMRKFTDTFISSDIDNVKSYVVMDVLIPAAKKAISDIIVNGIDMILYGETSHRSRDRRSNVVDYVSYNRYSRDRERDRDDRYTSRSRSYSYDDIILDSRAEAEEVLNQMDLLIDEYKFVSVADLYDLVGLTGNYTDNKYGWKNIRSAEVVRDRDGYYLRLPKALPID